LLKKQLFLLTIAQTDQDTDKGATKRVAYPNPNLHTQHTYTPDTAL